MDEETKVKLERIRLVSNRGTQIRDWLKHPGWGVFQTWAEKSIQKDHNKWLREEDEKKAEQVRKDARWFFKLKDLLTKMIAEGDAAKRNLDQFLKQEEEDNGEQRSEQ